MNFNDLLYCFIDIVPTKYMDDSTRGEINSRNPVFVNFPSPTNVNFHVVVFSDRHS